MSVSTLRPRRTTARGPREWVNRHISLPVALGGVVVVLTVIAIELITLTR